MSGWKHDKLSNSEVMKEFEKVAYEKGMIEDNSIIEAAKRIKKDVKSDNLISNLFSLANKLKQEGFDKYADELEKKIMAYQVSKIAGEKDGEKLLEFAHPEGSPNVGDGEDGNVENLIDQHKKMVEVALKEPKMSKKNAKVLADVMVALGQNETDFAYKVMEENKYIKEEAFKKFNKQSCVNMVIAARQLYEDSKNPSWRSSIFRGKVERNLRELLESINVVTEANIAIDLLEDVVTDINDIMNWNAYLIVPGLEYQSEDGVASAGSSSPMQSKEGMRAIVQLLKQILSNVSVAKDVLINRSKYLSARYNKTQPEQIKQDLGSGENWGSLDVKQKWHDWRVATIAHLKAYKNSKQFQSRSEEQKVAVDDIINYLNKVPKSASDDYWKLAKDWADKKVAYINKGSN